MKIIFSTYEDFIFYLNDIGIGTASFETVDEDELSVYFKSNDVYIKDFIGQYTCYNISSDSTFPNFKHTNIDKMLHKIFLNSKCEEEFSLIKKKYIYSITIFDRIDKNMNVPSVAYYTVFDLKRYYDERLSIKGIRK